MRGLRESGEVHACGVVDTGLAIGQWRRQVVKVGPQAPQERWIERVELEPQASSRVAGSPPVKHSGDRRRSRDPCATLREAKRHLHGLAGQDSFMRLHEHPGRRQIQSVASDETIVALPHHQAGHADGAPNGASLMRENERSDHGCKGIVLASVGYNFWLHAPTLSWVTPPPPRLWCPWNRRFW